MAEPAEAFIGIVLADRYELTSVLGQGQGGMVFKARHRQLERFVAVKLLTPENMSDKTAFMRFEREARSIGRLNHPNIVTVFDVGNWRNERPFLVMDYIEGMDLQDLMGEEGRLPVTRCLRIITQVCSALHHAHKRGVIHRDLKPRNVMVINEEDITDFVKLVDFGIAKDGTNEAVSEGLTLEGYVVGTPQYMSPEQCLGKKVDARTDVYSLCSVLYRMITGSNPILGNSIGEIMNNQIHQVPLPFEKACKHIMVPKEIQRVIFKGLSKDPDERQASMAEFRAELNEAFARVATQALAGQEKATAAQDNPESTLERKIFSTNLDGLRERAVGGDVIAQYELVLRLEYGQGCKPNPEEARRWLLYAAQKGMKEAQWRIGDHYLRGEAGFEANPAEAAMWLSRSAEQGYDLAQFSLGWCYEFGLGITQDFNKAALWYGKASKQGNEQASERLKICADQLGKIIEAEAATSLVPVIQKIEVESNDPEVLFSLGCKARDSRKPEEIVKAMTLFKRAALFGHDSAQLAFISLCLTSDCHADAIDEAIIWLEKAISTNDEKATLIYAACLRNGIGVKQDSKRSQQMLEDLASEARKYPLAQAMLACALLLGDGIGRNIPRGIALLKSVAESDDGYAKWKLALCCRNGIGVMKDTRGAESWFQKAADAGFPQGFDELWKPAGLKFEEAIAAFKSLMQLGNRHAFFWMGICHENGIGVARDINQALIHYEQAHSKGVTNCQKAIERIKANL